MATLVVIEPIRTYATRENAIKSVEKKIPADVLVEQRYIIMTHTDGRFYPVFIGMQAVHAMLHFHFNILG